MSQDLVLFAHLLVFLVGTLLYGFLTRELLRQPVVLPGWPIRLLSASMTLWYLGCLVDGIVPILLPAASRLEPLATAADLVRGLAWVAAFPLLVHSVWRLPVFTGASARQPSRYWVVPPYLTLVLFAGPGIRLWRDRTPLMEGAWQLFPWILAHAFVGSLCAVLLLWRALHQTPPEPNLSRFVRWLIPAVGLMFALLCVGGPLQRISATGSWPTGLWRLTAEGSGLLLGGTFLYFVQRYNLLRLSLSYSSLRHFLAVVILVVLVMSIGPAVGAEETGIYRRFVAVGLVIALISAASMSQLQRLFYRRFPSASRLLGETIQAQEIDAVVTRLQSPDASEETLRKLACREIGSWLKTRAFFLARPQIGEPADPLWEHLAWPSTSAFNRLDAPRPDLAAALTRCGLHAVFPWSVGGRLEGVLGLEVSATGGGYQEGEMDAVTLVLRQLTATVEVRRLLEERMQAERRMAQREQLSMLGMVSASLAHELKNPLSSIKALAQTLREEAEQRDPSGDAAKDLNLIVEQMERLNTVARQILTFARPETSGSEGGIDLHNLLERTLWVLEHEAKRRGIVLEAELEEVGLVPGSPATWQSVALNLVLNALQHAPAGSTVSVRLNRDRDDICFGTENGGEPIPESLARHLFEPFVTAAGTGLGLALVAQRVAELGGSVDLDNQPQRIRFSVRVPAATGETV